MDRRNFVLKEREIALRRAIEALEARTPRGGRPPDAVVPAWDGRGGLICPRCRQRCFTPIAWNPYNGLEEKMVLIAGKCCTCPHKSCGARHYITEELAQAHNSYFYPEDFGPGRRKKREDG